MTNRTIITNVKTCEYILEEWQEETEQVTNQTADSLTRTTNQPDVHHQTPMQCQNLQKLHPSIHILEMSRIKSLLPAFGALNEREDEEDEQEAQEEEEEEEVAVS